MSRPAKDGARTGSTRVRAATRVDEQHLLEFVTARHGVEGFVEPRTAVSDVTLLLVAHDSTNLTEGTGGPQDPAVLMTAEDVLADLAGIEVEVLRAERVAREVSRTDEHGGQERRTAWDCLVRVVRR